MAASNHYSLHDGVGTVVTVQYDIDVYSKDKCVWSCIKMKNSINIMSDCFDASLSHNSSMSSINIIYCT